jgi:alkylation response protein AidB-like acyl-CoA dehydrogenase
VRLELTEEQQVLHSSLDRLANNYSHVDHSQIAYVHYSAELQQELFENGFLQISVMDGYGPLDAALLVERIARLPYCVEVAASALVAPALGIELTGPLALCEGIQLPTRYLAQARHVLLADGDGFCLGDVDPAAVQSNEASVIAYPTANLLKAPVGGTSITGERADRIRSAWRLAIAAEGAGMMRAALDLTVGFVKERKMFKRSLGDFQAVQHRLAQCERIVSSAYWLTMRAAYTNDAKDIATAALFVQQNIRTVNYDCHQFHGAMGTTLEYPLHKWTYRLKLLQGELGGPTAQAMAFADAAWGRQAA